MIKYNIHEKERGGGMKRKIAVLFLCVMLLCQMAIPSAGATEDICFVAAGEYILPVSDSTMPFWSNGYLYISSSIFTGTARDALGISSGYDKKMDAVVLYNGDMRALAFEVSKNYAQGTDGKIYYPGALRQNGEIFVPVALLAKYFNLQYSYNSVPRGHLMWLRKAEGIQLPDNIFADAASIAMEERYNEYQKSKGISVSETTPTTPNAVIAGQAIYLCLQAGEDTSAMLDALARYGSQAAFFCDLEFLETQGALLRRMTATGQAIGILVDGEDPELTVAEQVEKGNALLEQATFGRTRLVRVEEGSDADEEALEEMGYCCMDEDVDRSGHALRTTAHAESLQKRLASRKERSIVWLKESANAVGLQMFLRIVTEENSRCMALTETT